MSYLPDIELRSCIQHCRKTYDIVYDVVTYDWQEQSSHLRYHMKQQIIYDIVALTYDIKYNVTYDVVRMIGKNSILTYNVTYNVVRW